MENQKHESEELEFKIDDDVIARIIFDMGYKKGRNDKRCEEYAKGYKKGYKKAQKEIALALLADDFDIEDVAYYTGMTLKKAQKLSNCM